VLSGQAHDACGSSLPAGGINYMGIEGESVSGATEYLGDYTTNDYPSGPPPVFFSAVSDVDGHWTAPFVSATAGQILVELGAPSIASGPALTINVHPLVGALSMGKGGTFGVTGAGFAQPVGMGPRTSVSVAGNWATNVVVAADGKSLTFTPPVLPAGSPSHVPVVVYVDGVASMPLDGCTWNNAFDVCYDCHPATKCPSDACGPTPDGCGGTLACPATCGAGLQCTSNHCCATGSYWNSALNECITPTKCRYGVCDDGACCRVSCKGTTCM
jgi:hypothetical protein